MRVLLVNKFWHPKGGSERYTFLLKDLLESKRHEVIPFAMDDERNQSTPWSAHFVSHVDFWEAADAVPNQTSAMQKLSRIFWSREAARQIAALIAEVRPDVAHLQNFTHQISPSILPVLRRAGVPIVWTIHDLDVFRPGYRNPGRWGHRALAWAEHTLHHHVLDVYRRNIDAVIAPSQFAAGVLRDWGWKGRVEVMSNFVMPTPPPAGRGGKEGVGSVLFVGRSGEMGKGMDVFLAAAERLPKIPFEVIGVEEKTQNAKWKTKNISWWGVLPPTDVAMRIASTAMIVVPSTIPENAPYVILEAMAAGVPVVASRIGGIPELVRDGQTGVLVPTHNPEILAKTIEMVYHNEVIRRQYGERARAIAVETYGPDRHYGKLSEIYRDLLTLTAAHPH